MATSSQTEGFDEKKQDDIANANIISSQLFDTEVNILTKSNMNIFTFTGYPNVSTHNSNPKFIADEVNRTTNSDWPKYGYQTKESDDGVAYIQIDLQQRYYITKCAVSGYMSKHKPKSVYYLRASNDAETWTNVGMSDTATWTTDENGTYPFRHVQQVTSPGFYRYYQFYASGFDNGYLLIMNAGLWTPQKMSYKKWTSLQRVNASASNPMSQWNTQHVIHWIATYVNWGNVKLCTHLSIVLV